MDSPFIASCEALGDRLLDRMSRWFKPRLPDEAVRQKRVRRLFQWSFRALFVCVIIASVGVCIGTLSLRASVGYFTVGLLTTKPFLLQLREPQSSANAWRFCGVFWFGKLVIDVWQPQPHSPFSTIWQSALFGAYQGIYWIASVNVGMFLLLYLFRDLFLPFILKTDIGTPNPADRQPDTLSHPPVIPIDY